MLKDITLGQYFPGDSLLHRMDPRAKIICSILYIVAIFCAQDAVAFLVLALSAVCLILLSRISIRTILRGLKPILFVLIFTALISLFLTGNSGEEPLWSVQIPIFGWTWQPSIRLSGIVRAVFTSVRVVVLIIGTSIFLTYTTSPVMLTDAIESLLFPLTYLHVPVHTFAMMMTIALRFIPTLIEETDKIMNAQKARGADFESGSLVRRARALIPVLVPLFVSAFKRAEDLAIAMECRCYRGGVGRTKMRKLVYGARDYIVMLCMALFLAGIFVCNHFDLLGIRL